MLPLPNLDNKTYQQLFDESVKLIKKYYPQWTDENLHDPGITLIEMLAWLVEMQQYYLNQLTPKSYLKFLKLLGITPLGFKPQRLNIGFRGIKKPVKVLKGTPVFAGDIPFELCEGLLLMPVKIEKILVKSMTQTYEHSLPEGNRNLSFYAFGADAKKGSILYIGFDRNFPKFQSMKLYIDLFDRYPVEKISLEADEEGPKCIPFVEFKYYSDHGWTEFAELSDKTDSLTGSGAITFQVPKDLAPIKIFPANDRERYWISLKLLEDAYHVSPRITGILPNTGLAMQKETLCRLSAFSGNGKAGQGIVLEDYLSYCGEVLVQVKQGDGTWVDWNQVTSLAGQPGSKRAYIVTRCKKKIIRVISFGSGSQDVILPKGKDNVRVLSCLPAIEKDLWLGRSNGQINQTFNLKYFPVLKEGFKLQVGRIPEDSIPHGGQWSGADEMVWEDWELRESLETSGKEDRHFILDEGSGTITFGNGLNGMVPPNCTVPNIRVIDCSTTFGEKGNITGGTEMEMPGIMEDYLGIEAFAVQDASGGRNLESLEELLVRFKKEQRTVYRAVTAGDFVSIALRTPGVRLARVKAIPGYYPGMQGQEKVSSHMTLVVVPYGESKVPKPTVHQSILERVKRHIDRYRQVTTCVHVTGPYYVRVRVYAAIVKMDGVTVSRESIVKELERFIRPLDGEHGTKGWQFGRPVYKSEIYAMIKGVEGVSYIKELSLGYDGSGSYLNNSGDIIIPDSGLVYSGEHQVDIVEGE
ncbi:MAG: putative baseplate assembly protein [Clostridia bacterium]|nr:putative baseplate assembly protein [Clostridia bacterium]